jgi:DNA-binding transcriptional MerR regulator
VAWSTRELAELTGTTVNTIRHYHRIALLDEPTRRYNGYKQCGVLDLVRRSGPTSLTLCREHGLQLPERNSHP